MSPNAYFLKIMNTSTYGLLDWVVSVFSVVKNRPAISEVKYPYQIIYHPEDQERLYFANPVEDGYEPVLIEGSSNEHPLFNAKAGLDIKEGDIPLHTGDINTSYGIILGNMYLLYYPFGNKFKFINDVISGDFDNALSTLLVDYPEDGKRLPDKVYIDEFERYSEACGAIAAMDKLFSTGGSYKTLTVAPEVLKLRDQLIEKHKHELSNPLIQAQIEQAVVAADKASFKGDDDGLDFLVSKKSFNPTRKKQLIVFGGSSSFSSASAYIPTSLKDGWKIEDIPTYANDARYGSISRGLETAKGGAKVKEYTRMTMNFQIADSFCGTRVGKGTTITEFNYKQYIGLNIVGEKEPIHVTAENVKSYIGRRVMVHSPQYCKSMGDSYCPVCVGDNWSLLKHGLNAAITNVGDVIMGESMSAMHGKQLRLTTYHFLDHIS